MSFVKRGLLREISRGLKTSAIARGLPEGHKVQFATEALHIGSEVEYSASRGVTPAIELSSTFVSSEPTMNEGYSYSRFATPSRSSFERQVAALEGATMDPNATHATEKQGALAFSSGTAAISAAVTALVKPGGHIVTVSDVYGGTLVYFNAIAAAAQGVKTDYVDIMYTSPGIAELDSIEAAHEEIEKRLAAVLKPDSDMLWIETPANPTMRVVSMDKVIAIARKYAPKIRVVVDNTFASPFWQNPFDLTQKVDVILHSATKYLNGHSDVLAGVLVTKEQDVLSKLRLIQKAGGAPLAPFDSWLAMRGAKTLELRSKEHALNAQRVALWLQTTGIANGYVRGVEYPGLKRVDETAMQKATREVTWQQMSKQGKAFVQSLTTTSILGREGSLGDLRPLYGDALGEMPDGKLLVSQEQVANESAPDSLLGFPASGMLAVRIKSDYPHSQERAELASAFLRELKVFQLAVSLGGTESLAQLPLTMTHVGVGPEQRAGLGIDGELVRISIGLEDPRDLIADLEQAFRKVCK